MKDPVRERIEREINEHDVVLFMKGTPASRNAVSLPSWFRC
jgi:glutaredoxin-related protein